jgi:FkbH-like protein
MTASPPQETAESLSAAIAGELNAVDYHRLARRIAATADGLQALRVAVLSTCTLDFVRPFLIVEGARAGLRISPWIGPFGQVEQQVGDTTSELYASAPELLVVCLRPDDVVPDSIIRPMARGAAPLAQVLEGLVDRVVVSVTQFRAHSTAPVLVANFAEPAFLPLGVFDANVGDALTYALAAANASLRDRLSTMPNVTVWDLAGLVRRVGTARWTDRRLWSMARVPVAAANQPALAAHLARSIRATQRPPAKCIVLDLDNTLWGGVIGDDGIGGIQLGDDHPGSVFKDLQRRLLALADRGILLAVVSKNDAPVAEEVFRRHPDMLIRWDDLAATRINWEPKSGNLRAIAKELNIGSDQLVFFDDNPVEQAEVRLNAPEVLVAPVPADPLRYAEVLDALPWFDQVAISDEDRKRTLLYRERRERSEAEQSFESIDAFLASLAMTAEVGVLGDETMGRIAQLIGKTNQFNLTTRRHSASDLAAMAADPRTVIGWARVSDRFGDQGLVAIGILRCTGELGTMDTFLMSCRVMNRRVEHALMAFLAEHARRLGVREIEGEYIPTPKNGMVREFYPGLGFAPVDREGRRYRLALADDALAWPPVIARKDAVAPGAP